ncbi:MAG: hypothetical protein OHK0046_31230 [Anaerolineae bacterium]
METYACGTAQIAPLDEEQAVPLAELFKTMGDPNRMRIISLLLESELCVVDIARLLGMGQSAVSHQMRALRVMRLVKVRKAGRHVYYTLDDDHVRQLFEIGLAHVKGE